MNKIQMKYLEAKEIERALISHPEDAVYDAACEDLLDAEYALIMWSLDQVADKMPAEDIKMLRDNWHLPKYNERMIDLALRLSV